MKSLLPLIFFILTFGCSRDEDFNAVYQVEEDFQPFVETFLQEAADRGHTFEITNLILKLDPLLAESVCGSCNSLSLKAKIQKIVTITTKTGCWEFSQQKEALIFHQLAHCVLGRDHNNELLPNGDPKSMMVEGNFDIYAPCIYKIGEENCNNTFKRGYYLDELFDENTPVPDWAL